MTHQLSADPKDRIILGLDVDTPKRALQPVHQLKPYVGCFKIGFEFVHSLLISMLHAQTTDLSEVREVYDLFEALNGQVFWDTKLHDIPNTVAKTANVITRLGVRMFNVHASGGIRMMRDAKEASLRVSEEIAEVAGVHQPPLVLGVTILTSLEDADLVKIGMLHEVRLKDRAETQPNSRVSERVVCLAKLAQEAGLDGVVCSPQEAAAIRHACGNDFVLATPGIRASDAPPDDQKRTMTPAEAIRAGAHYLVMSRPILQAPDRVEAAKRMADEIELAMKEVA